MGVLVDVTSEEFLLPRKQFAAALRALEAFEGGEDLEEALEALCFRFAKNDKGDLVELRYGSDKAPSDAGDLWPLPLLEALAPFVKQGIVVVHYEGDARETVHTFGRKKVRTTTRLHEAPKKVAPKVEPETTGAEWITAPEESFGLEWRLHMKAEHEWYRKRERLGSLIDALAKTKAWSELEELYFKHERVPVKSMSAADVKPHIANGRWLPRWLASADRQATLEIDVATFELGLRLRLRDAALARVGQAAVDELADAFATWARAHRGEGKVLAHVGAFGPGYTPRATFVDPNVQPARDLSFRADALVTIVTPPDDEKEDPDEDLAVQVTRRMGREHRQQIRRVAAANAPRGGIRTDEDDLVVVKLPCSVEDRASISAAADAHAAWIAPHVRALVPVRRANAKDALQTELRADDPRFANYRLSAWVSFSIDDDPYWFRDRALFEVVYRAIAKTSWWAEVAAPGTVQAALKAVVTGRNDRSARLSRGDDAEIVFAPNVGELVMRFATKRPKEPTLHDLVTIISEVRNALRGRGQLEECAIRADSARWHELTGIVDTDGQGWPRAVGIVDVVDPFVAEDGRNGHRLHAARVIAAAEPPPGVERVDRDGLVALFFTEDVADPVKTAAGCVRHASWIQQLRASAP